ncbi:uncharacterized protein CCOS01_02686 [Colletotrichum costaricense]|uniref:Uncharacterized protein n=1 Tax=Colletotrichum costaricense TaxID=1209916 RepID=A0AAI9Z8G2_9PEZI|nr:uncharacterized protein CCOS01_02686 [Colletotrichum costaricense]KAK1537366.1 hypothetical protein CCOS01_02686 [Colletotrichum costaricense]
MPPSPPCGSGDDNGAVIPTTAGLPVEPTCPDKEVEASAPRNPIAETHATGVPSHQSSSPGWLIAFKNDYNRSDDFLVNGGNTHDPRKSYLARLRERIKNLDNAFTKNSADRANWLQRFPKLSTEHNGKFTTKVPWAAFFEQARAQTTSERSERRIESGSSAADSTLQTGSIFDKVSQQSISDTTASTFSEDHTLGQFQEGHQKPCSIDGEHSDDSSENNFGQDDQYSLEISIRRVLAASPKYADAVVDVLQRRLQDFIPRSHDSSEVSTLLTGILCTLGNHAKYEAVDGGSSSKGKRSTGLGKQSSATPASATIPAHLSPLLQLKRDKDEDEDEDKKREVPPAKRARRDEPGKHLLCPYFIGYRNLVGGACRAPTSFRTFSDLKNHLRSMHFGGSRDELHMDEDDWKAIEEVLKEASQMRPKKGTDASYKKHLGTFQKVWGVLFPNRDPWAQSPFCEDYEDLIAEEAVCENHEDFITEKIELLSRSIFDPEAQQAFERREVSSPTEFRASRDMVGEMLKRLWEIVAVHRPEVADQFHDIFDSTTTGMMGDQRIGSQNISVDEDPGLSRAAADTQEPGPSHPPQVTFKLPLYGREDFSHPGSTSVASHETLVQPDSAIPHSKGGKNFCDQEPRETDPPHIERDSSQTFGNYHPQEDSAGTPSSQIPKPSLAQEPTTSFLDETKEYPMPSGFDWDMWQREESASTLVDWDSFLPPQLNEYTEEP